MHYLYYRNEKRSEHTWFWSGEGDGDAVFSASPYPLLPFGLLLFPLLSLTLLLSPLSISFFFFLSFLPSSSLSSPSALASWWCSCSRWFTVAASPLLTKMTVWKGCSTNTASSPLSFPSVVLPPVFLPPLSRVPFLFSFSPVFSLFRLFFFLLFRFLCSPSPLFSSPCSAQFFPFSALFRFLHFPLFPVSFLTSPFCFPPLFSSLSARSFFWFL